MTEKQQPPKPLPPSVAKVFDDFLQRLGTEADFDQELTKRLKSALLDAQTFDADSLGDALRLPQKPSP